MQVSVHQDAVFTCKVLTLVLKEVRTFDSYFLSARFSLLSSSSFRTVLSTQSLFGNNPVLFAHLFLFCFKLISGKFLVDT